MPTVLVRVTFQAENSNRVFYSGYRPAFLFDGNDEFNSGRLEFIGCETVRSGMAIYARLTMLVWDRVKGIVQPGRSFELYEGPSLVGYGHVMSQPDVLSSI